MNGRAKTRKMDDDLKTTIITYLRGQGFEKQISISLTGEDLHILQAAPTDVCRQVQDMIQDRYPTAIGAEIDLEGATVDTIGHGADSLDG